MGEGRVLKLLADIEFLGDEAVEVVVTGKLDGGGVGGGGLDDDFSGEVSTTGAAGDLGEELEGALTSAEVGGVEGEVGIEDADECDVGEVEAFGDHLGAEEDVDLFGTEVAKGVAESVFSAGGVGVEARDLGGGEDLAENDFGFFGAVSLLANCGIVAVGAGAGDDGLVAADVADEAFFGAVVGEGDGAVVALDDVAAGWALEGAGEAAAVEEDDDLFVRFEAFFNGSTKDVGDDGVAPFVFLGLDAHIDNAGEGEGSSIGALGEFDELVFTELGVLESFERGGGGAEEDGAFFEMTADDGEVTGVILGWVFLFVGGFVFFIDDDEAEVLDGSEDGAAGPDDDAGFAGADAVPFVKAFAL